ncbi:MAG: hypothetical protein MJ182_01645 [Treponema sp.]|nr:hypothetical protein [Treponema sp.]
MDFTFFESFRLPSHDEIFSMSEKMTNLLENEKNSWRPVSSDGNPGSLLDFTDCSLPVIIIPDLHARPLFLKQICEYKVFDMTVLEALEKKLIHVVFVGDALHSEKTTKERWHLCEEEFEKDMVSGSAMREEMSEGLSLLMMLFELKTSFPDNFHFLKGNHENIMNVHEGGDFPFRKYAEEGRMVKAFVRDFYGDDVLYMLSLYEKNLPLVYSSKRCVVSHGEPRRTFTRDELINARLNPDVVSGLIWTENNEAQCGSVSNTIENLFGKNDSILWFGGHRPVNGKCALRQDGRYIQIHNPLRKNIVFLNGMLNGESDFDPERDIVSVIGGVYE